MTTISFAGRLCHLREQARLTTYALAKKCGLTKQALYRLENGSSEPTWQTVQLLAAALGVEVTAFVDPSLRSPEAEPVLPRGRPRKADAGQGEKRAAKKSKRK
ncbi:MAG TPA: helix-turn-helix transcriptional regulator [Gemmataceae bacterium]|nr:helix-turn-helix transcriptional regulator [Gemmataceae bacterium]